MGVIAAKLLDARVSVLALGSGVEEGFGLSRGCGWVCLGACAKGSEVELVKGKGAGVVGVWASTGMAVVGTLAG